MNLVMKTWKMTELAHIIEGLRALALPISSLKPDPSNARKHNKRNLESIRTSFERYGQVKPIAVRKSDLVVLCGNGRLQVAQELGWTHLACVQMTGSEAELASFALIDNQSADLAEWDEAALSDILSSIAQTDDTLLQGIGFSDAELNVLVDSEEPLGALDEQIPQLEQPGQQHEEGTQDEAHKDGQAAKGSQSRSSRGVEGSDDRGSRDPQQDGIKLTEAQADSLTRAQAALSQEKAKDLTQAETIRILCNRYLKARVDREV
jgi:ParB-like chromosome segregation protein Spo0J